MKDIKTILRNEGSRGLFVCSADCGAEDWDGVLAWESEATRLDVAFEFDRDETDFESAMEELTAAVARNFADFVPRPAEHLGGTRYRVIFDR